MIKEKTIKVASAIITEDGKILLLRRSKKNRHFVGQWQLPEGKIEASESPVEALTREITEELSCDLLQISPIEISELTITVDGDKVTVRRNLFSVELNGIIKLSDEHDQYKWFKLDHLPSSMTPGTCEVIESYIGKNTLT